MVLRTPALLSGPAIARAWHSFASPSLSRAARLARSRVRIRVRVRVMVMARVRVRVRVRVGWSGQGRDQGQVLAKAWYRSSALIGPACSSRSTKRRRLAPSTRRVCAMQTAPGLPHRRPLLALPLLQTWPWREATGLVGRSQAAPPLGLAAPRCRGCRLRGVLSWAPSEPPFALAPAERSRVRGSRGWYTPLQGPFRLHGVLTANYVSNTINHYNSTLFEERF